MKELLNPTPPELKANAAIVTKLVLSDYDSTFLNYQIITSENLDLPELKELSLSHPNIGINNLFALLQRTKKLEKFYLRWCENLADDKIITESLDLSELKEINLSGSNISATNLLALLQTTKKLEKLILAGCKNLAGAVVIPADLDLSELKEINLDGSNISATNLFAMLQKAPKLEKLNLTGCTNLSDVAVITEGLDLSELKEINLPGSNISATNLLALLQTTKKLEKLNLAGCKNLSGGVVIPEGLDLSELKEINLSISTISVTNLFALLQKAPKLEVLDLSGISLIGEAVIPEGFKLDNLKHLDVSIDILKTENVNAFLDIFQAATKLESINFNLCANLSEQQAQILCSLIRHNPRIRIEAGVNPFSNPLVSPATMQQLQTALAFNTELHEQTLPRMLALIAAGTSPTTQKSSTPSPSNKDKKMHLSLLQNFLKGAGDNRAQYEIASALHGMPHGKGNVPRPR